MTLAIEHRERALKRLHEKIQPLSELYHQCYRKMGRGALKLYTRELESGRFPSEFDYLVEDEALDIFEDQRSKSDISRLISEYNPSREGVLMLITDTGSFATWFVTIKWREVS